MAAVIALPVPERAEPSVAGWPDIQEVPCSLSAEIPVSGFKVCDLLLLQAGSLVNSGQSTRGRVAVRANGSFLAWAEFEVLNGHLSIRITDLD